MIVARFHALLGLITTAISIVAEDGPIKQIRRDLEYAHVDGQSLTLDLHLPSKQKGRPLIVWVHGGAWRSGSKASMPLRTLVEDGYPVASVDYRLSTVARFPAQIHDIKAAIRFLRGHQTELGINAKRVVVAGDSAGAHLAALTGVSNGLTALEGTVGNDPGQNSNVQAILSFYGASNLETILQQSTPHGLSVRVPALELLLGGQPENVKELARLASPVTHVDAGDPPLLLLHGDQDPQMPVNQSLELDAAYRKAGVIVELLIVPGAAHGGAAFYDSERMLKVRAFLRTHFDPGGPEE